MIPNQAWSNGNNPNTAAWAYVRRPSDDNRAAGKGGQLASDIDKKLENKLLMAVTPGNYLRHN